MADTVEFGHFPAAIELWSAMGGQIVDATWVPAPKQRHTEEEKAAIEAGKSAEQIWCSKPGKANPKKSALPERRPN